jgi:hypothetical protein
MNLLPPPTNIAFFLLAKAPAQPGTRVDVEVVKERLQLLVKPKHTVKFDEQTPAQEVEGFYQCMAAVESIKNEEGGTWMYLEQQWLAYKLHSYWAHLRSICKAEDVALMRKNMIKFPWQANHYEYHTAGHIAECVFYQSFYRNQELVQQRTANYRVDDATRAAVHQWMLDQGLIKQ